MLIVDSVSGVDKTALKRRHLCFYAPAFFVNNSAARDKKAPIGLNNMEFVTIRLLPVALMFTGLFSNFSEG